MSNIVVDSSVVISALYPKDQRSEAASACLSTDDVLHAPALIDFEVVSIIRRFAFIDKELTPDRVSETLDMLATLPIQRVPMDRALSERVFAHRGNLSAYDASYVALAETIGATLVTADLKLANAPGLKCVVEAIA
jgi:predicted nucleic acid-binding protein